MAAYKQFDDSMKIVHLTAETLQNRINIPKENLRFDLREDYESLRYATESLLLHLEVTLYGREVVIQEVAEPKKTKTCREKREEYDHKLYPRTFWEWTKRKFLIWLVKRVLKMRSNVDRKSTYDSWR